MKQRIIGLSQRYVTALRKHLKQGPRASLLPALRLGRQAVSFGLETLDLARIHERAITTLELSGSRNGVANRAEDFFAEALIPIVATHRAARQSRTDLNRLAETLDRRTRELAAARRQLQHRVVRHKISEDGFKETGKVHHKCLEESLQLQSRLRQLTHRVLAAQESERYQISHELQDEIAQTLLGINIRLLSLKQEALGDSQGLKNAIASAQSLVVKSARSVRRFVRKLDAPQPVPCDRSILSF